MDPKNINWKVVAAVLAGLGYLAFKAGGLNARMFSKLSQNGTVAAVLAIVAYFGWDFVFARTGMQTGPAPAQFTQDNMPPNVDGPQQQNIGMWPSTQPVPQHRTGIAGPGGLEMTEALGC